MNHQLFRILFPFFICFLMAQTPIVKVKELSHSPDKRLVPNDQGLIYYDKNTIYLNGEIEQQFNDQQIIDIQPIDQKNNNTFLVYSLTSGADQKDRELLIHFYGQDTLSSFQKPIPVYYDSSIPRSIIINDRIVPLRPENQSYTIIGLDVTFKRDFFLFKSNEWNHEKNLIPFGLPNDLYLLGMQTPYLDKKQNVSLFKIIDSGENQLLFDLNLSLPYLGAISESGIFAIVGTRVHGNNFSQKPYLIYGKRDSINLLTEFSLSRLPKHLLWLNDTLFLIEDTSIKYLSANGNNQLISENFEHSIYPIFSFTINNSVFIVGAKSLKVNKTGVRYSDITLIEYEQNTSLLHYQFLAQGPSGKLLVTQFDQSLYLHLDHTTIQFRIGQD